MTWEYTPINTPTPSLPRH